MLGSVYAAAKLAASQEGLISMELAFEAKDEVTKLSICTPYKTASAGNSQLKFQICVVSRTLRFIPMPLTE
jgi:hypothetical protein